MTSADHRDPFDATWRERLLVLGILYLTIALALIYGLLYQRGPTVQLLGLAPAAMFAIGKFLPLFALSDQSYFSAYELGLVIWALDTFSVVNIVYTFELFDRIPVARRTLDRIQGNAALLLRAYPWMRRAAMVGVVAVVLFPVTGTGPLAGAFLGLLLGLHRRTLILAVSAGGLIGGTLMAFLTVNFESAVVGFRDMQRDPLTKYLFLGTAVVLLILVIWLLGRGYRRALARARAMELEDSAGPTDQSAVDPL